MTASTSKPFPLSSLMTAPRRASGARHCTSELSGTTTSPLATPSSVISTKVHARPGTNRPIAAVATARPIAPSGISPVSTLPLATRPASSEPAPTPIANSAYGTAARSSGNSSTCLP